jgi:hypothetical protein
VLRLQFNEVCVLVLVLGGSQNRSLMGVLAGWPMLAPVSTSACPPLQAFLNCRLSSPPCPPQGVGAPCCARILTSWFAAKERGTYWGMWNIAHNMGGFFAPILAGTAAKVGAAAGSHAVAVAGRACWGAGRGEGLGGRGTRVAAAGASSDKGTSTPQQRLLTCALQLSRLLPRLLPRRCTAGSGACLPPASWAW